MTTYRFQVEYASHDSLREGITCLSTHHVVISAATQTEASLIALQMVSCLGGVRNQAKSGMPTRLIVV